MVLVLLAHTEISIVLSGVRSECVTVIIRSGAADNISPNNNHVFSRQAHFSLSLSNIVSIEWLHQAGPTEKAFRTCWEISFQSGLL